MPTVFDHIAIATHKVVDAPEFLVGELGGISGYGGPSGDFSWWHWDFEGGGRIEIIEPDGPEGGFVHRHLDRRGPSIHHVNFEVESLRKTCDLAEKLGFSVVGYDDSHEYWQEAFLHPKSAMGIVVQLVQETHHDHDGDWEHPNVEAATGTGGPAGGHHDRRPADSRQRFGGRPTSVGRAAKRRGDGARGRVGLHVAQLTDASCRHNRRGR